MKVIGKNPGVPGGRRECVGVRQVLTGIGGGGGGATSCGNVTEETAAAGVTHTQGTVRGGGVSADSGVTEDNTRRKVKEVPVGVDARALRLSERKLVSVVQRRPEEDEVVNGEACKNLLEKEVEEEPLEEEREEEEEEEEELPGEAGARSLALEERRRRSCVDGKKRVRFSVSRMDCDTNFKLTMSIKKESDGVPVFFKVDGNRFKKERTVKLMVDTRYRVDFSFKPTQTMTGAIICGEEVDSTERVYDSTASAYSSRLHTEGALPSPKGHRDDLPFVVLLKGGLVMQMSLQVKFYKYGDSQHCDWGSTFHCIEYDCETHTDAGIVAILKETVR